MLFTVLSSRKLTSSISLLSFAVDQICRSILPLSSQISLSPNPSPLPDHPSISRPLTQLPIVPSHPNSVSSPPLHLSHLPSHHITPHPPSPLPLSPHLTSSAHSPRPPLVGRRYPWRRHVARWEAERGSCSCVHHDWLCVSHPSFSSLPFRPLCFVSRPLSFFLLSAALGASLSVSWGVKQQQI